MPRIILTFLESYDFEGKEIIPFCTSDNDGIETGLEEIRSVAPNAKWQEDRRFDGGTVTKSLDINGKLTDETLKQEIADFAGKTSPNSKANKNKSNGGTGESAEKAFAGEEAPFEEDGNAAETKPPETSAVTTAAKSEQVSELTTLGEHDTPYIPVP